MTVNFRMSVHSGVLEINISSSGVFLYQFLFILFIICITENIFFR